MKRVLVPEWLDAMPPGDPAAAASRRDLRRINAIMGNFRWLCSQLATTAGLIVEIGAGDGGLARLACGRMPSLASRYHALDLLPCPAQWPYGATWHQMDVRSYGAADLISRAPVVVANMVLHHFEDADLRRLGGMLSDCTAILACEPCRREFHVWQGRLLFPLLHKVTRHDMIVSIRAGFRGTELPASLGLDAAHWHCQVSETLLGAYRMAAVRNTHRGVGFQPTICGGALEAPATACPP